MSLLPRSGLESATALGGLSFAFSSFSRSALISAMCRLFTSAWLASVSARIPPHQPVPTTATPICFMTTSSSGSVPELLLSDLDVGFLDELRVFIRFLANERAELLRRARHRDHAELG